MNNQLINQIESIIDKDAPLTSNLANISSMLYYSIPHTSWAGFYLTDEKGENLFLNCFQGPIACIKIPFGKGVCGVSAMQKIPQLVDNVLEYPGHIACSSLSRSEVVVPIIKEDLVVGVIDLDSNEFTNFTDDDVELLVRIAEMVSKLF